MIRRFHERLRAADPLLLLLRTSLIVLVVNSNDDTPQLLITAAIAVIVLPRERVLRSPWFWAALFVAVGTRQLATWHLIDDHIIVTTYWLGALALGLGATDERQTLALASRLLIGTTFALAAAWKLGSGEFIDGTFFRYSLAFDSRFETLARVIGGISPAEHHQNLATINAVRSTPGTGEMLILEGSRTSALAYVFTGWGVLIETAVAVTFLLPLRGRGEILRHASLIVFAATTYLVVPVAGFGALLGTLGSATATSDRVRVAYLWGIVALFGWALLWPLILG